MSFFRNFGNVVSSQTFTKPNNLVLRSCNLPKALTQSIQPSIDHLHTVKALLQTIQSLKAFETSVQGKYLEEVKAELQYLEKCRQQYRVFIKKYVQNNGILTAEGIANLYAAAPYLQFNSMWLQNYVYTEIQNKSIYMSKENLEDVIDGLNTYHSNSEILSSLNKILAEKSTGTPEYVTRIGNQTTQFQHCDQSKSNNTLIRALQQQTSFPVYFGRKWSGFVWSRLMTYFNGQASYYLHSQ